MSSPPARALPCSDSQNSHSTPPTSLHSTTCSPLCLDILWLHSTILKGQPNSFYPASPADIRAAQLGPGWPSRLSLTSTWVPVSVSSSYSFSILIWTGIGRSFITRPGDGRACCLPVLFLGGSRLVTPQVLIHALIANHEQILDH